MDSELESRPPARAGVVDLLRLGVRLAAGAVRSGVADAGSTVDRWAEDEMRRDAGGDVVLAIPGVPLELVGNRAHSDRVLSAVPDTAGYSTGTPKRTGMTFLAPGALTIVDGTAWHDLRKFNEQVLDGRPHPHAQSMLGHVRAAFSLRVSTAADVRSAMGRAMVPIVLGRVRSGEDPAGDVTRLFGAVSNPVKRLLFGFLYRGRRRRLYAVIGRAWDAAPGASDTEPTLVSRASGVAPAAYDRERLLQQVPHWMFTFTGSGADLLTRTLCMVTSRPEVHRRVVMEIRGAGPPGHADTIDRLAYLEACLMETGRLFPPVTKTYHRDSSGPGKARELVHYFPLLQRDDRLGPTVHEFRPERWLEPQADGPAAASNLFLRGPRACPGMNVILFVCKAAAALQVGELGLSARQDRLARDPLPVSFPKPAAAFTTVRPDERAR